MIALLEAAASEGEAAVADAFAEGYKAGLLDAAPDTSPETAYWRSKAESWRLEATRPRLPWWSLPAAGALGAIAATFAIAAAR